MSTEWMDEKPYPGPNEGWFTGYYVYEKINTLQPTASVYYGTSISDYSSIDYSGTLTEHTYHTHTNVLR